MSDAGTGRPVLVVRRDGSGQLRDASTGEVKSSWGGDGRVAGSGCKGHRTKSKLAPAEAPPVDAAAAKSKLGSLASAVSGLDDMMAGLRKPRAATPDSPVAASGRNALAAARPGPERQGDPGGVLALRLLPGLYLEYDIATRGVTALLRCRGVRHAVCLGPNEPCAGGSASIGEATAQLEREDLEAQARRSAAKPRSAERPKAGDASDPATLDAIKSRLSSLLAGLAGP